MRAPLLALLLALGLPGAATAPAAHDQALAVEAAGEWREWWRAEAAPARWTAPLEVVAGAIEWRTARPGLEWGELRLSGSGEAWRIRVILVRLDPRRLRLRLHSVPTRTGSGNRWTIAEAPTEAALALNTGQFEGGVPWGWVVRDGIERRPPGPGPLAPAVVVDSTGGVRLVPPDSIAAVRAAGGIAEAFQSYPAVLAGNGEVPLPLRVAGLGVNHQHRDARLALGELRDGRVLIALTRFEGLGGVLSNLPFGLTTPEMAALMGALGARRALLLDGGISSQLLLRDAAGETHVWRGLRNVPLGLVAVAR